MIFIFIRLTTPLQSEFADNKHTDKLTTKEKRIKLPSHGHFASCDFANKEIMMTTSYNDTILDGTVNELNQIYRKQHFSFTLLRSLFGRAWLIIANFIIKVAYIFFYWLWVVFSSQLVGFKFSSSPSGKTWSESTGALHEHMKIFKSLFFQLLFFAYPTSIDISLHRRCNA